MNSMTEKWYTYSSLGVVEDYIPEKALGSRIRVQIANKLR